MSFGRLQNFLSGRRKDVHSPPPRFLAFRSSKAFIIFVLCTAIFSDMFLYGIIIPVVPFSLTVRAGVLPKDAQRWVSVLLAIYGASLLVMAPLSGWYADRTTSRRLPLLLGLIALAGATVILCLAKNITLMVIGRLLQGCAAAVVWTVGMALMVDTVGQKDVGQCLGYIGISMTVGVIIAPLLGGVVYERLGYYAVYYVCFGLLAVDIILRLLLVEKKIAAQWDDAVNSKKTTTACETIQLSGSNEADNHLDCRTSHESSRNGNPPLTMSTDIKISVATDAVNQEHISSPSTAIESSTSSLPLQTNGPHSRFPPVLTLLASRRLLAALWGCIIQGAVLTAFDAVLPLFVARTFHWSSTGAGLIFIPIIIPSFASPLSGAIADKYGPRWIIVAGFLVPIPCLVLMRYVTHNSTSQIVLMCALLAIMGAALAAVLPPLMAEITYIVEAKEVRSPGIFGAKGAYAQAYGLFVMAFAAGCLVGPVWAGFVEERSGWGTMVWTLAVLSFGGAVPALIWTGGLITKVNAKTGDERAVGKREAKGAVGSREEEGLAGAEGTALPNEKA